MLGVALVAALLIGFGSTAHADFSLELINGTSTVTITDNGSLDANPATGSIKYNGTVGTWDVSVTLAETYPVAGSTAQPELDIESLIATGGSGSLQVEASATGYQAPSASPDFTTLTLEAPIGTASVVVSENASDSLFGATGTNTTIASLSSPGTTTASFVLPTSAYSLTEIINIPAGTVPANSYDRVVSDFTVPEPLSILFLGLTLLGGGVYTRLRKKNNA
jgi:hypothetical protein